MYSCCVQNSPNLFAVHSRAPALQLQWTETTCGLIYRVRDSAFKKSIAFPFAFKCPSSLFFFLPSPRKIRNKLKICWISGGASELRVQPFFGHSFYFSASSRFFLVTNSLIWIRYFLVQTQLQLVVNSARSYILELKYKQNTRRPKRD